MIDLEIDVVNNLYNGYKKWLEENEFYYQFIRVKVCYVQGYV